jgi:hypothetical protein
MKRVSESRRENKMAASRKEVASIIYNVSQ